MQVLFVTHTQGHAGPDVVTPESETEWLRQYYRLKRRSIIPIALWAGPIEVGEYGRHRPRPSINASAYHLDEIGEDCLVIDGRGILRAFHELNTPAHEARLIARVEAVLRESRDVSQVKPPADFVGAATSSGQ